MPKWEYATVPLLVHATKQILDNWGEDGWELIQVVPGPNWRTSSPTSSGRRPSDPRGAPGRAGIGPPAGRAPVAAYVPAVRTGSYVYTVRSTATARWHPDTNRQGRRRGQPRRGVRVRGNARSTRWPRSGRKSAISPRSLVSSSWSASSRPCLSSPASHKSSMGRASCSARSSATSGSMLAVAVAGASLGRTGRGGAGRGGRLTGAVLALAATCTRRAGPEFVARRPDGRSSAPGLDRCPAPRRGRWHRGLPAPPPGEHGLAGGMQAFPGGRRRPARCRRPCARLARCTPAAWADPPGTSVRWLAVSSVRVRETFEESGVLLASAPDGSPITGRSGVGGDRRALVERRLALSDLLERRGLECDRTCFGRGPTGSPRGSSRVGTTPGSSSRRCPPGSRRATCRGGRTGILDEPLARQSLL